jgi:hypothetical protein
MAAPRRDSAAEHSHDADQTRLIFRNTMKITPGHTTEFRQAILDAVAFAEHHAPQLMVDVFIDEPHDTATSFQIYADSDAVLRHWQLSDPYIAEVMKHCTIATFEVFGSPSADVLAGLGRTSGISAAPQPRLVGYLTLEPVGSASQGDGG